LIRARARTHTHIHTAHRYWTRSQHPSCLCAAVRRK
jgi:hypothetical protein